VNAPIRFEQTGLATHGQPCVRAVNHVTGAVVGTLVWSTYYLQYVFMLGGSAPPIWTQDQLEAVAARMAELNADGRTRRQRGR
jgi:hypothetical protein